MTGPGDSGALGEVLHRAADPERYERWAAQAAGTGYCRHPIRLAGRLDAVDPVSGELAGLMDTAGEPDGVLLVACGNRRATVCPSCAATYRADAWQLVAAGLRGGKGVPASVAAHPRVFVTLTAPSFGPVHSRREDRAGRGHRCRPRLGDLGSCRHGTPSVCEIQHDGHDPLLGQPICPACFDYEAAVLFNCHVTALWQATVLLTKRALAARAGISTRQLARRVRLAFGKVAEYQARGVVHLHAVARLDAASTDVPVVAAPEGITVADLIAALTDAARVASVALPSPKRGRLSWGTQFDIHPIPASRDETLHPIVETVAGYLAKYATKSTGAAGALDRPIRRAADIDTLEVNSHLRRMVATCWRLGADPAYRHLRLRAWAHTLGFRGHLITKSRRYSTTFTALRTTRHDHARARAHGPDFTTRESIGALRYTGRGYTTLGDAWLADTARARRAEARQLARLDRYREPR